MTQKSKILLPLFLIVLVLLIFRIPVVMSAGAGKIFAKNILPSFENVFPYVLWSLIGIIFLAIGYFIPYQFYTKQISFGKNLKLNFIEIGLFVTILFLIAVYFMPKINNTHRWLSIFGFSFQPSEFARYILIFYLSHSIANKTNYPLQNYIYGFLPKFLFVICCVLLILFEPHNSISLIIIATSFLIFIFAKTNIKQVIGTYFLMVIIAALLIYTYNDYAIKRVENFLNGKEKQDYTLNQNEQALVAFGNGGIFGEGPGKSKQRDFHLSEPTNDFVYAIIGEDYGFIGTLFVATLFLSLFFFGCKTIIKIENEFARLISVGIILNISMQAFLNMGVALSLFPNTGVPLPFLSEGGTALITSSFFIGIFFNITKQISGEKFQDILRDENNEFENEYTEEIEGNQLNLKF